MALPGTPPLCYKGHHLAGKPSPAPQNSWQISPWKATAKPAAHPWHHFSCLYQALPWGLHTLGWDTHTSTHHHGSAGLWGHQKVHRV